MSGKRLVDLSLAIPFFVITLPLQLVVALAILATMGRPVLFLQQRPGLHARTFTLVKFRTMRPESRTDHFHTARVTPLGRWLRKTSLDELPELFNIIRGDMSIVGPRPLLSEYLSLYSTYQAQRHNVKPGLTGMVQVHGRNRLSWKRKFRYDVWYVNHHSFALDMKILCLTVRQVFSGRDVNQSDTSTMEPFRGEGKAD